MRQIQYFRVLICLLTASTIQMMVYAADLNPPDWRGQPGTTYQQWLFHFDKTRRTDGIPANCLQSTANTTPWGQRAPPELVNNPYQQTTGICVEFKTLWPIAQQIDWIESYGGKQGVWKLTYENTFANFLNFIIPNTTHFSKAITIIVFQIAYQRVSAPPEILIQTHSIGIPPDSLIQEQMHDHTDISLPDGWNHYSVTFRIIGCPRVISAFLYPPKSGQVFIDSVLIDTKCTEYNDVILNDDKN